MKKKLLLMLAAGTIAILSGCGQQTPEDMTKQFVETMSEAKVFEAKKLTSSYAFAKINALIQRCREKDIDKLVQEAVLAVGYIQIRRKSLEQDSRILPLIKKSKKEMNKRIKRLNDKFAERYGSPDNVPYEEKKREIEHLALGVTLPVVKKELEIVGTEYEEPDIFGKTVALSLIRSGGSYINRRNSYLVKDAAKEIITDNTTTIPEECIGKYTDFLNTDKIDIIETEMKTPDKAMVRMELVYHGGGSKKSTVKTEKMQGKWTVSNFTVRY